MTGSSQDTIVAPATPPGRGGVGVIRLSGEQALAIAATMAPMKHWPPQPRYAHFIRFRDDRNQVIDEGLLLYFPAPHSFTGEHVIELHGHGGPVILDRLVQRAVQLGARIARPGEFSERAFLNDKLDLAQAEAIADLIDASSEQAARSAVHSLQGVFSQRVNQLVKALIELRMYVEAAIDFPEEEIDFLADDAVSDKLTDVEYRLEQILQDAQQGILLQEGMTVVLAGRPNAGKSSLLNTLAGSERAIVTAVAGTTRDLVREDIHIDGMPLHVVDTAGLRESPDEVEREGIRRAREVIATADRVLLVVDSTECDPQSAPPLPQLWPETEVPCPDRARTTVIWNKIDLIDGQPALRINEGLTEIFLSAKQSDGIDLLRENLKQVMGFHATGETQFSARRRHMEALHRAQAAIDNGRRQMTLHTAGELLAEDLRLAQRCLSEITGEFTSDDLLGEIFSSFCIGK